MRYKQSIDSFNQHFTSLFADTPELRESVYKLRYQVFCIENAFEDPTRFPDQMEHDLFDYRSLHYLIRHNRTGAYAATVRLILPDKHDLTLKFPLELNSVLDRTPETEGWDRRKIGEISRLCVSKAFRNQKEQHGTGGLTDGERLALPIISLSLLSCIIKGSYEHNLRYVYSSMEPAWLKIQSSVGFPFQKIGPLGEYHGKRWPTVVEVAHVLDSIALTNPGLLGFLTGYHVPTSRAVEGEKTAKAA